MKLWWVHCETMIASLKLFMTTKIKNEKIFKDITKYHLKNFQTLKMVSGLILEKEMGYLQSLLKVTCKGPYHIPRMLVICQNIGKVKFVNRNVNFRSNCTLRG